MAASSPSFDVVIVGAGLSGIGAACHLRRRCPGKTFTLLESRAAMGGTWELFRYPGVRSDSDMHTLGYGFKPWVEAKAIADGPSILSYLMQTAKENDIDRHVRFEHRLVRAAWDSNEACWSLQVEVGTERNIQQFTCQMLLMCSGYYNYDEPYDPGFEGVENFLGTVVHPQFWPQDLNYIGKKVIVIGSGATAMTIVPAMATAGAQVTMVQRSATYVVSMPDVDAIANTLQKFLPDSWAYVITRWKNTFRDLHFYRQTRTKPDKIKADIVGAVREALGPDFDVDTHFTPSYNPWDQRLCLIPNDDLFEALKSGKATIVTDRIKRFTERGLLLESDQEIQGDIIVTATGLKLTLLSNVTFTVDGEVVEFADTFSYKGMMFSDVPNLIQTFGYINASWTLRSDLTADYACRVINHMHHVGMAQCTPRLRAEDANMKTRPWIDDFSAGYVQRMIDRFPKQGDRAPWVHTQDYWKDRKLIRNAPVADDVLSFTHPVAMSPGRKKAS